MLRNLLVVALTLISLQGFAEKKKYQICAVAFYNLENFFDTVQDNRYDVDFIPDGAYHYTSAVYYAKVHNLATVLQKLGTELNPDGPALIGAAETEHRSVLSDLVAQPEIKDRHYGIIHFESPDSRGIDVALIYNPKYFKVLSARALPTNISLSGEKGGHTRDVLYVTGILAGDTTHVFVNHWPSRRGGEAASAPLRAIAAGVSRHVIDSLMAINPETRVINMGDLNDDPTSPSIASVLGAVGDAAKVKPGGLYNPFTAYFKQGIGTLGFNDAWNLFDQIMISSGWLQKSDDHWRFYRSEIFSRNFLKESFGRYKGYPRRSFNGTVWNNGYSDHFPVLIYLVKPL